MWTGNGSFSQDRSMQTWHALGQKEKQASVVQTPLLSWSFFSVTGLVTVFPTRLVYFPAIPAAYTRPRVKGHRIMRMYSYETLWQATNRTLRYGNKRMLSCLKPKQTEMLRVAAGRIEGRSIRNRYPLINAADRYGMDPAGNIVFLFSLTLPGNRRPSQWSMPLNSSIFIWIQYFSRAVPLLFCPKYLPVYLSVPRNFQSLHDQAPNICHSDFYVFNGFFVFRFRTRPCRRWTEPAVIWAYLWDTPPKTNPSSESSAYGNAFWVNVTKIPVFVVGAIASPWNKATKMKCFYIRNMVTLIHRIRPIWAVKTLLHAW